MSSPELRRLTLVYPPTIEDELVELLLDYAPELPGFTTLAAAGHGGDFTRASPRERVRGRVARGMLLMVLPAAAVDALLAHLAARIHNPHVVWWMEPVIGFGALA
ncbi:MAG: DUF3240 family protein [Gammaproteobacteria bacterium]